jgi:hypothetical protein
VVDNHHIAVATDIVSTDSLIRILNNTFLVNPPDATSDSAIGISSSGNNNIGESYIWHSSWGVQILNNIEYDFATPSAGYGNYLFELTSLTNSTALTNWVVNYNDYRSDKPTDFFWNDGGGSLTPDYDDGLSAMNASNGWESAGITNNPLFVSLAGSWSNAVINNYTPLPNSPVVNAGTNLSALGLPGLNFDLNGNPRPPTNNWDIGAYQH